MKPVKKNVLITASAYDMLINEYQFKPSQLLAKIPTLEDRIKSPKTNRFIHIGSVAYMKLLSDGYTEEDLLLRRDGYILSPDTKKLVKVFSKTFNVLLSNHDIESLLKLPRLPRGDNNAGVEFNLKEFELNKKIVDNLINSLKPIIVYTSSLFCQSDDDETCNAFQCAASIFNQGELISFYEAKEYRIHDDALSYNFYKQNPLEPKVNNMDEHFDFLLLQNERSLINIKLEEIDLLSMYHLTNKPEVLKILKEKYKLFQKEEAYFKMIKYHVWFISNASLMKLNVKFTKIIEPLIDINDDRDYEKFDKIIQSKKQLIEDVNQYYPLMIEYIENL